MDARFRAYWRIPLRLLLGVAFLVHGLPKLGAGHAGFAAALERLHVPAPGLLSWVSALVEVLGGVALLLGALVAVAALLLTVDMLVAMFLVHLPHGFSFLNITGMTSQGPQFGMPGAEVNLLYIAGLLALFIGGTGPLSFDERVRAKERWRHLRWARARTA
jgi:putative oxidoreductase